MLNTYLLNETITNGFSHLFLSIISFAAILCGILVIVSKNPIVSVLFLIGLFLSISGYLMMLGMNFIGLSYLLVYVGAVSILFLFILMLINVRISELVTDTSNSIPLAILTGIFFNSTLYQILPSNTTAFSGYNFNLNNSFSDAFHINNVISSLKSIFNFSAWGKIFSEQGSLNINNSLISTGVNNSDAAFVSSPIWDGSLSETSHIATLGNVIYTSYPIWLIITSIILLLAMVGAIVITIKQKN